MMIYMGEPLASWEAEILSGSILDGHAPDVRRPLFIEQELPQELTS